MLAVRDSFVKFNCHACGNQLITHSGNDAVCSCGAKSTALDYRNATQKMKIRVQDPGRIEAIAAGLRSIRQIWPILLAIFALMLAMVTVVLIVLWL